MPSPRQSRLRTSRVQGLPPAWIQACTSTARRSISRVSRLRKLAAALAPAYMRVSGTWANTTYFHDADTAAPTTPPKGFDGVLTASNGRESLIFPTR